MTSGYFSKHTLVIFIAQFSKSVGNSYSGRSVSSYMVSLRLIPIGELFSFSSKKYSYWYNKK